MDLNLGSLDVAGFQNRPVPNTHITQSTPSSHLGIILPGYRYPAEMPCLHYAGRVLLNQGADLLRVEYAYNRTNYMQRPKSEQDEWMSSDVFAVCNAWLAHHSYKKISLVGKSLGTLAMGHLLTDVRFQQAVCIWLTPLLSDERLCSLIEKLHRPSLFVIGTADPYYQPEVLHHLENVTRGRTLVLEAVDHSLEIQDDIPKSLEILSQITQAVQEFIEDHS